MKTFFRFLSKHKLYAIVEILGLSIALTFVILMNSVVMEANSTDASLKVPRTVYALHSEKDAAFPFGMVTYLQDMPEIESTCMIFRPNCSYDGEAVATSAISSSFRDMFTLHFTQGGGADATEIGNFALVSEELAAKISPDQDCVGKEFEFSIRDPRSMFEGGNSYSDKIKLMVTGVFKDPGRTVLAKTDLFIGFEQFDSDNTMLKAFSGQFFVKLANGIDIGEVLPKLQEKAQANVPLFMYGFAKEVRATRFRDIHFGIDTQNPNVFRNITDVRLYKTFLYISLVILLFALLNYISLTVAFSRFRLTELATRRLLGEQQRSIHLRIIMETAILMLCSLAVAALLAWAFKDKAGTIMDMKIQPLDSGSQIAVMLLIVPVVTIIAGSVSSFLFSRFKPIEIIKGEARYNDKTRLGKVFIAIQGAASIAVLALSGAILMQTRMMVNIDAGYRTDNILTIGTKNRKLPVEELISKVRALPCTEKTGGYNTLPAQNLISSVGIEINGKPVTIGFVYLDFDAISILGFRHDGVTEGMLMRDSDYEKLYGELAADGNEQEMKQHADTTTNDFMLGSIMDTPHADYMCIRAKKIMPNVQGYVVKVTGSEADAMAQIRSLISDMGYTEQEFPVRSMRDWTRDNYKEEFRTSSIFNVFSLVCILLTALAVLALSSYWTRMRTRDTAVRKVFGCSRRDIFLDTVKSFVAPVLVGAVVAIPLAWWYIGQWLEQYAVRIDNSIWIYLPAILIVLLTVVLAICSQAVRLMNTNPVDSIKSE